MYKKVLLLACFYASLLMGQQQELYDPYTPEYFSVGKDDPAWLKLIVDNPSGVNFFEMEKKFGEWLDSDPDARRKTPEKKPAVNFYRRWQKAYRPFVNGNGEIVLPTKKDYFDRLDKQNQRSNQLMAKNQRGLTLLGTNSTLANTNKWRSIGPFTTSRNTPNPDVQGRYYVESYDSHANVFRIDVFKKNPNILYSGAETGAVFKTTDKGKNWVACAPSYNFGINITAIRIDPQDSNAVWVGSTSGLFFSKDGGDTFDRVSSINSTVNSIRISDDRRIVTVTTGEQHRFNASRGNRRIDGFFISEDGGKTFRRVIEGIFYDHELKPKNSNIVYLYGRKGSNWHSMLYISYDGGKNFTKEVQVAPLARPGRLAVSDATGGEDYLYALVNVEKTGYNYGQPHILQSKDGGLNWTDKTVTTDNRHEYQNTFCPSIDGRQGGQGYYDMMIGVSGTNPEHVIFGLCSAYRSLEGGSGGYRDITIGGYCNGNYSIHADMQDIAIAGNEVWLANDGGIKYSPNFFKSENGQITGEDRVKGIYAGDYYGFGQGWNEDVMAGGRWHNGDAVMMESYGEGKAVYVGGVEQATGYVMVSNPKKVYFSDAGMFVMPDRIDGRVISLPLTFLMQPYETLKNSFLGTDPRYAQRILYHPKERFGNATRQIWETPDEGQTFNLLYDAKDLISNVEFARSNPNVIYACGWYFIYKSVDNGKNWTQLEIPKEWNGPFPIITLDPKDENKIWLTQSTKPGGVLYSADGGKTWQNVLENNSTMKNIAFRWVVLAGDEHNGVYLGTENGSYVYYKDDTMTEWIDYSNGLPPAARLTRLVPFFKEGKLRAATNQGIWEIPLYREKFKPIAQPLATNISKAQLADANMTVEFESYSIVNQDNVQWEWSFNPQPYSIDNPKARNPKVVFKYNGEYDVTLKVTTPQGTDSKTIKKMIVVNNGVLGTNETQEMSNPKKITVYPTLLNQGEELRVKLGEPREKAQFKIYNANGTLVKTVEIETNASKEITVPTHGLPKGVYLFQYSTYSYIQRGKFIIK
ncbi:T9SS type A sorting domain-containing protein [Riemerella anatipestifer]|uniref:VPS10 domain-containing protein n=1 Tax=Riemerella anatipestifer TaxID=34085 RepID=UPI001BDA51ED|nr:PKD domain-containing protein [Riemerella anatipestifer]MBT0530721.1 T9SS type A sorting domain-containing protein [Riemerella anatipestifer]MBT0532641.1 T9SS type A sorting domain-containing protein [Riemerella anatipestifer]MDR7846982.1 PKD domain-containing protein [Riemerella anatipestifer]MDY3383445.1 PKD domain-containing protein [Riemerella anatipestifer]MDY3395920.1 PKD domain-containing protein [Riemerella anatipestifer]